MYKIVSINDKVRVNARLLGENIKTAVYKALIEEYEGKFDKNIGLFLSVIGIDRIGTGIIVPEDPAVYYDVDFRVLVYQPEIGELVEGEVKEIREFGAFIEIGPLDGLVHLSQVMDDIVGFSKTGILQGKKTKRTLKVGDHVKARVIAVSYRGEEIRIGLTMRQYGLGKKEWYKKGKR